MSEPGLKAVEISRARRNRLYVWLAITAFVSGLMVAAFILHFAHSDSSSPQAAPSASASMDPPIVKIHDNGVFIGDREVARTDAITKSNRMQRIDGLFDALKEIRATRGSPPPTHQTVILDIAFDVPAIVVKSVFQTASYAGFDDVEFMMTDGGIVRP